MKAIAAALFACACCIAVSASANDVAPIHVTVNGVSIKITDFGPLAKAAIEARPHLILKDPGAMPSDAPLIYYAGDRTIWQSRKVKQDLGGWGRVAPAEQPAEDAFNAALALLAMDVGTAGEPWATIYRETPVDRTSRLALGTAVAKALKSASDQSARYASDQVAWMRAHIVVGTTRKAAYDMLRSRGLTGFNPIFEKRRAVGPDACLPSLDPASDRWPYPNEPVPSSTGLCAVLGGGASPGPNPDALIEILGAFGPGCDESIRTTLIFDASDRVRKVVVDKPWVSCV